MRRMWVVWGLTLAGLGCSPSRPGGTRATRITLFGTNVPFFKAPEIDRCKALGKSSAGAGCDDARYLGTEYTRRLAVGTRCASRAATATSPGSACKARAAVIDTGTNRVKLEIRGTKPDSRWFNSEMRHAWYEEGALVDLYLSERGY